MGAVLGLGVGVGLALVLWSFVSPPVRRVRSWSVRPGATLASASCALTAFVLVLMASRALPVALAFGVIAGCAPFAVLRSRERRRQREHAEVWPEAVDNLGSAVRAGLGLADALGGLAERGPEPLRPHFAAFTADYHAGMRFDDALDRLKERLADPVGDRVVEALRLAREVGGGDLGRLLRSLSGYLREDARTRSELEARQAWTVNGARLAVAAPWLVLLLLCLSPDVIARYASPAGAVVLTAGGLLCATAYSLMMRIGRLPTPRRILR